VRSPVQAGKCVEREAMSTDLRLDWIGYVILCIAGIAACFWPMAGLPIGIVGGALFLYGSWRASRDH
jgi:hypothetical protein